MKAIGSVFTGALKAVGLVKTPGKAPKPIPTATRDDAREKVMADDALRRRRGGAADILTGSAGAEASAGATGKSMLGQ